MWGSLCLWFCFVVCVFVLLVFAWLLFVTCLFLFVFDWVFVLFLFVFILFCLWLVCFYLFCLWLFFLFVIFFLIVYSGFNVHVPLIFPLSLLFPCLPLSPPPPPSSSPPPPPPSSFSSSSSSSSPSFSSSYPSSSSSSSASTEPNTYSLDLGLSHLSFIDKIGQGRFAAVWRAKMIEDEIAVKVFPNTPQCYESWSRESEIYETPELEHKYILSFRWASIAEWKRFICMGYFLSGAIKVLYRIFIQGGSRFYPWFFC